ncbi:MAG: PGPGW domain-containing protein [Emcibacteraceae bacterium]|nr:PGPGW domain-containing protein [Emcibacteraceae bacterium]
MSLKAIKRPLKLLIGWLMFIVGIITAPIPIPIGQIIALIGLSILVSESHWVKTKMQRLRRRLPIIGRQLARMHPYLPRFLKKVIDDTDPAHLAE